MWKQAVINMGGVTLASHQLESAKSYYRRVLAWPGLGASARLTALEGMACYHKERKEWVEMTECCEKALALLPDAKKNRVDEADGAEMAKRDIVLPLLLADAAEGQGDMRRAREIDEATRKLWAKTGRTFNSYFVDYDRR